MKQQSLFHRTIKSIDFDQDQIILDILNLHSKNGVIDLDPTFSIGKVYDGKVKEPIHRFDLNPQVEGVLKSDCRDLPFESNSLSCIFFDPPFIISKESYTSCKMKRRFSGFSSFSDLISMYDESLKEFYRILEKQGIVIFKCQDTCNGRKQYFTHCKAMQLALKNGFYVKDFFIYLTKTRMINHYKKQQHARKFHCYFWVFQKSNVSVNYQL